jgi:ribosomal protein L11 methylase PrmA
MSSKLKSSFRDPCGYVLRHEDTLYREILAKGSADYQTLINSGIYSALIERGLLVPHIEVEPPFDVSPDHFKTLKPQEISFISYPYEWCFYQLKDAALLTLQIMMLALEHGMILKDASAYNVQFSHGKPLFIDTLSFAKYEEGTIWPAYRQFCQHFLAPLALMSKCDVRLSGLLSNNVDGISLDLASTLLPVKTWFHFSLLLHIHLHARSQRKYAARTDVGVIKKKNMSKKSLLGLLDSLSTTVKKLTWKPHGTEWGDYYHDTNYSDSALSEKQDVVRQFIKKCHGDTIWDLGANTGMFSLIAAETYTNVISFDIDPGAVEKNYLNTKDKGIKNVLPLLQDLNNPSTDIGWGLEERNSLIKRGPADICLVLALIHHLAISNNVPLPEIARFLQNIAKMAIVEFVPKEDSQVKRLLATREDIFPDYNQKCFEDAFSQYFKIVDWKQLNESERIIYLMESLNR